MDYKQEIMAMLSKITDAHLLSEIYWYIEGIITGRWK